MANQNLYVVLESEKEGRKYYLHMPMGAPIGEAYDQCHEFMQEVVKMAQMASDKAKQQATTPITSVEQ